MKKTTKLLALMLALVMVLSCFAGCKNKPEPTDGTGTTGGSTATPSAKEYTYRDYSVQLGSNWNPHTYETNYDSNIMQYLVTPFATMAVKDSEKGEFQWVFKAATSVADVTKEHQDDLTKYKVNLPAGKTAQQVEAGYVFEFKLNPEMKWENGTPINADTYIYSMKALLDPKMRNYRANLYYSGESAVAGGNTYYNSGSPIYTNRANAYKQSVEASLGGLVKINLIECPTADDIYGAGYDISVGSEANFDVYDMSGWGPDYGDPQTYLDTILPDYAGYMTMMLGIF